MQEKIGNVILDYTWYPGEDLYSDGAVEDRLLEIARTTAPEDLDAAVAKEADWAVLYHLSHVRENITASLQLSKEDSVLEIGAGCGAVTGALARMAGSVTCIFRAGGALSMRGDTRTLIIYRFLSAISRISRKT